MNKMWMMGYNDGGEFNMGDSFNGRKLRPLIPRPAPTSNSKCNNTIFTSDIHCSSRIQGTQDFIALNHHLAMAEQSKRDFNPQQVVVSSRWNPTPEQLQTLEDLYRRGTRTPNAEEIQQITAQLRRYGKIEGKNVFYWFQNHKARERQKRRRQLESVPMNSPFTCTDHASGRKDLGVNNRTGYEVEQTKNWAIPTNCSSTFSEKIVSREAVAAAAAKAKCSRAAELGWIHFEGGDHQVQQMRNLAERNATWHMMNLSCSSSSCSSSSPSPTYNLINTNNNNNNNNNLSTTIITSSTTNPSTVRSDPSSYTTIFDPYSKLFIKPQDLMITHGEESQTLQLFPLGSSNGSGGGSGNYGVKESEMGVPATNNHQLGPRQFFEFLPLKN